MPSINVSLWFGISDSNRGKIFYSRLLQLQAASHKEENLSKYPIIQS